MRDNDQGFAEFVARELPGLLRLGRVLTLNEHDAWDLAQECLVRVGTRWSRLDQEANVAAYAHKTLVNLNLNRLRRLAREPPLAVADAQGVDQATVDGDAGTYDPWLEIALKRLPPRQRAVFALRFQDSPFARHGLAAGGPATQQCRRNAMNSAESEELAARIQRLADRCAAPLDAHAQIVAGVRRRRRRYRATSALAVGAVVAVLGGVYALVGPVNPAGPTEAVEQKSLAADPETSITPEPPPLTDTGRAVTSIAYCLGD
ncbi:hypothetical protein BH24ACT12_BH24ACT12_19580 [soil metagenome]